MGLRVGGGRRGDELGAQSVVCERRDLARVQEEGLREQGLEVLAPDEVQRPGVLDDRPRALVLQVQDPPHTRARAAVAVLCARTAAADRQLLEHLVPLRALERENHQLAVRRAGLRAAEAEHAHAPRADARALHEPVGPRHHPWGAIHGFHDPYLLDQALVDQPSLTPHPPCSREARAPRQTSAGRPQLPEQARAASTRNGALALARCFPRATQRHPAGSRPRHPSDPPRCATGGRARLGLPFSVREWTALA